MRRGVLVGSDEKQEWLLPWWWDNYRAHNEYPVTFVDFGLSEQGKNFCRLRGELVPIREPGNVGRKEKVQEERGRFWEEIYGSTRWWDKRPCWHQKPIAMLTAPYETNVWLDTDCEVLGPLTSLFEAVERGEGIALCPEPEEAQQFDRERGHIFPDEILFNSGVVGFARGSPQVTAWAESTLTDEHHHLGDQNLLSRLIYERHWPVQILDRRYNWRELTHGKRSDVLISHWVGDAGKFFISMKQLRFLA